MPDKREKTYYRTSINYFKNNVHLNCVVDHLVMFNISHTSDGRIHGDENDSAIGARGPRPLPIADADHRSDGQRRAGTSVARERDGHAPHQTSHLGTHARHLRDVPSSGCVSQGFPPPLHATLIFLFYMFAPLLLQKTPKKTIGDQCASFSCRLTD